MVLFSMAGSAKLWHACKVSPDGITRPEQNLPLKRGSLLPFRLILCTASTMSAEIRVGRANQQADQQLSLRIPQRFSYLDTVHHERKECQLSYCDTVHQKGKGTNSLSCHTVHHERKRRQLFCANPYTVHHERKGRQPWRAAKETDDFRQLMAVILAVNHSKSAT